MNVTINTLQHKIIINLRNYSIILWHLPVKRYAIVNINVKTADQRVPPITFRMIYTTITVAKVWKKSKPEKVYNKFWDK